MIKKTGKQAGAELCQAHTSFNLATHSLGLFTQPAVAGAGSLA